MYHLIEALSRWIAPLLSFTAEEIWQFIPGKRNESIFLNTWYKNLFTLSKNDKMDSVFWKKIQSVRNAVNKEIENLRAASQLGSALEAEVTLHCDAALKSVLDLLEDELRFVLITSKANVVLAHTGHSEWIKTEVPGLWLAIQATSHAKCERCWHRRDDVGKDAHHPTLCGRCVTNVDGKGEVRKYA